MPVAALKTPLAAMPADLGWRLSVPQYHAMIDADILTEDDPVELLDGWLVPKMPKKPPHRLATGLVREALERLGLAGWYVDSQEPITTIDSEPEPDVAVVRGERRDYVDRHPGSGDVGLVVEVADSSLERDRTLKRRLYAAAGIAVYWIVNLVDGQIEVLSEPLGAGESADYRHRRVFRRREAIPVELGGTEIGTVPVEEILTA